MSKRKPFTSMSILKLLTFLFFAGLGAASAAYEQKYFGKVTLPYYFYTMAIILVSIPVHVLLHEAGHLMAGLLSGYDFIMFRLFRYLWIQTDDGLSWRKQYIPGVLGQALMIPPEMKPGEKPPFLLYHLGGLILNGFTAFLLFLAGQGTADPFTRYFFYLSAVTAIFLFITNLLPFQGTDGYNILQYLRDEQQEEDIITVLYLYRDMVKGLSFKDLRKRMTLDQIHDFAIPNTVTFIGLHAAAYLEDLDFENAHVLYETLWQKREQLFEAHKMEVSMNYLFTLLVTNPTHPDVERIRQSNFYKAYQKIKQADSFRLFAAEALYLKEDFNQAQELLEKGEKEIPFSPTVSDEQLERILYDYLQKEVVAKMNQ